MPTITSNTVLCVFSCLLSTRIMADTVTLAWDPNPTPHLAGYRLYYWTNARDSTQKIEIGNATTALVPNLREGQTYFFAVTAYNAFGIESLRSNEVAFTVPYPPPIPVLLSAEPLGNNSAAVTWSESATAGAGSFDVLYDTTEALSHSYYIVASSSSRSTTITGLTPGIYYYLVVRFITTSGTRSAVSNELRCMIPADPSPTPTPTPMSGAIPPVAATTAIPMRVASPAATRRRTRLLKRRAGRDEVARRRNTSRPLRSSSIEAAAYARWCNGK